MEKRIRKQFTKELENIKKRILALGAMVEERVQMAIKAIDTNDSDLAKKIIKTDYEIDETEVEIEEECLKVLALHQPMAIDLRFIVAVIQINAELERIGFEKLPATEFEPFGNQWKGLTCVVLEKTVVKGERIDLAPAGIVMIDRPKCSTATWASAPSSAERTKPRKMKPDNSC